MWAYADSMANMVGRVLLKKNSTTCLLLNLASL